MAGRGASRALLLFYAVQGRQRVQASPKLGVKGSEAQGRQAVRGDAAEGAAELHSRMSSTERGWCKCDCYSQRIQPPARTRVAGLETDPPSKTEGAASEKVSEE